MYSLTFPKPPSWTRRCTSWRNDLGKEMLRDAGSCRAMPIDNIYWHDVIKPRRGTSHHQPTTNGEDSYCRNTSHGLEADPLMPATLSKTNAT